MVKVTKENVDETTMSVRDAVNTLTGYIKNLMAERDNARAECSLMVKGFDSMDKRITELEAELKAAKDKLKTPDPSAKNQIQIPDNAATCFAEMVVKDEIVLWKGELRIFDKFVTMNGIAAPAAMNLLRDAVKIRVTEAWIAGYALAKRQCEDEAL